MHSIETPRIFALRHDRTTLGVLRRCATALICIAGVALLFWSIGSLLGIGSGGYGNADCTGKHHVHQRSDVPPISRCELSSDVATPSLAAGQVPAIPTALPATSSGPVSAGTVVPDPKLATPQGRLDNLSSEVRWPVVLLDGLVVFVFGAGALLFTLVLRVLTWVRWGGARVAWSPDLTPVLAPRTGTWFSWLFIAAVAAAEGIRLTLLSALLVHDGLVLALASGVVLSWLLLTALLGMLRSLVHVFRPWPYRA